MRGYLKSQPYLGEGKSRKRRYDLTLLRRRLRAGHRALKSATANAEESQGSTPPIHSEDGCDPGPSLKIPRGSMGRSVRCKHTSHITVELDILKPLAKEPQSEEEAARPKKKSGQKKKL
jgi:hypothetical protein